jgi:hypothetical protein
LYPKPALIIYWELSSNKYNNIGINHRYRIEQRFFQTDESNSFNFRFRYSIMFGIPIIDISSDKQSKLLLNLGNEIFINAGDDITYDIFNQNRFIISPTYQVNEDLSFSLTWNMQFASSSDPLNFNFTNVAWLQIKHNMNLID